ncbi:hypothetical protein [Aquimarina celericrescens]|uniref:BZIP transcription factor n=1 Tax=Aquimarina celericrescens TaxID=1964542 RepID=A0ABW5AVH0_9FLAO|nr:hypothetical protein [Aquimarina celericrescens]
MKNTLSILIIAFGFSHIIVGQNYFSFNGSADVLFRYEPRGLGGRALVHGMDNKLIINYNSDFSGGTEVNGSLKIGNSENYFEYNGSADVRLQYKSRGSGGRALVHDSNNRLSINHGGDFTGGTFIGGHKIVFPNANIGIGTSNPDSKLTVKGKIHAEEVKIDLSVPAPDYVFKKEYDLPTLEKVQQYIQEKGHLPNIPSAKIMETEGVELGEMNMKLLEKIEELTLYIIEQEKEIEKFKTYKNKIEELERKLDLLLKNK